MKPPSLEDIEIVARTIWGEAEGEPLTGMIAVGWVIRNRVAKPGRNWGLDWVSVCTHPKQFSCWNEGPRRDKVLSVGLANAAYQRCFAVAILVCQGETADITGGADHYFTTKAPKGADHWPPCWALKMVKTLEVGRHSFFRSDPEEAK